VAKEWPEGFRFDPAARWDDEVRRLADAADADVVVHLVPAGSSPGRDGEIGMARECDTKCGRPAARIYEVPIRDGSGTNTAAVDLGSSFIDHGMASA
jgi:hypothetical protein